METALHRGSRILGHIDSFVDKLFEICLTQPMTLSWQHTKGRPIGLQDKPLVYGHMLEHGVGSPAQTDTPSESAPYKASSSELSTPPPTEDAKPAYDIFAPPESDSSRASSSEHSRQPSPKPDRPSPSKRRKLDRSTRQHVDLTSPMKKDRRNGPDNSSLPSNIKATQFTSSGPAHGSSIGRNDLTFRGQSSKRVLDDEEQDIFADFNSSQRKSQSKSQTRYHSQKTVNIHKAAPVETKEKRVEKKTRTKGSKKGVQNGPKDFKKFDPEPLYSIIQNQENKSRTASFQAPPALSSSPRSKRAALRSAKVTDEQQKPIRSTAFRKPPQSQSPQSKKACPPPFVVPQGLPLKSPPRRSNSSDGTLHAAIPLETADLDAIKAALNLQLDATTSSSTLSTGPSLVFDNDGSSSSSLSSARDVEEIDASDIDKEWLESHPPGSPKIQCPICKAYVSRLFLEEFSGSTILSLRQQERFCKAHKVHSAESVWRERRYPTIDWYGFQRRLPKYDAALGSVLNGTSRSFYRNVFEDQIKTGANRRLKQAVLSGDGVEGLNMGYYGTKGARIIMEYIMATFASRIRRLAGTDKLVSAGGVSGFVQAVLAPELAVMLVQDDMKVDDEQARVILKESSNIGNLLNEEEDEAIKDDQDEERDELS